MSMVKRIEQNAQEETLEGPGANGEGRVPRGMEFAF